MGFSSCGSRAVDHRLNNCGARAYCSEACGIFPDQGSNLCLLHRQADSLPLSRYESPLKPFLSRGFTVWYLEAGSLKSAVLGDPKIPSGVSGPVRRKSWSPLKKYQRKSAPKNATLPQHHPGSSQPRRFWPPRPKTTLLRLKELRTS